MQGKKIDNVCMLPDEENLAFSMADGCIEIELGKIDVYEALLIYYL